MRTHVRWLAVLAFPMLVAAPVLLAGGTAFAHVPACVEDVNPHGQTIRAGELVIAVMGSANRDPGQFESANRFDITREPNPHIAFGGGQHFCLGGPLARLEAKIALTDILERMQKFELSSDRPWEPRKALHVHGPTKLPIRFS